LFNLPSCVCSLFYPPVMLIFLTKGRKTTFRQYKNDVTGDIFRGLKKYMLVHSTKCGAPQKGKRNENSIQFNLNINLAMIRISLKILVKN